MGNLLECVIFNHVSSYTMTMHLVHPSLTTTGKRKGKQKFRNADSARKAREYAESWEDLKRRFNVDSVKPKSTFKSYSPPKLSYRGSEQPRIPSLDTTMGHCYKAPDKVYTGTNIVGIATMHKSNAVPVFSAEEAQEVSKMRRG